MLYKYTLIFLFFAFSNMMGQVNNQTKIIGIWKCNMEIDNNNVLRKPKFKIIEFKNDSTYYIFELNSKNIIDTIKGTYLFKNKMNIITTENRETIFALKLPKGIHIAKLNDSIFEFTLFNAFTKVPQYFQYSKINSIQLDSIILLIKNDTSSYIKKQEINYTHQNTYLIKSTNPKRKINLNYSNYFILKNQSTNYLNYDSTYTKYDGNVKKITNQKLIISYKYKRVFYFINNSFDHKSIEFNTWGHNIRYNNRLQDTFSINKIESINIYSNTLGTISTIGKVTITLSALTLLAAPLVSINYTNGNFNQKRFFNWSKTALIGISIGIPLAIVPNSRKRKITTKEGVKNYWILKSNTITNE